MPEKANLLVHRIFNKRRDTGVDVVFTRGKDTEIRWKLVDEDGHTILFTPVNTGYKYFTEAIDQAHFTLRRLNSKLDFNEPKPENA